MRPRAFVVMPFGKKDVDCQTLPLVKATSERPKGKVKGKEKQEPLTTNPPGPVQADFNAIYKELIAPALEQAGCEPFRADEDPRPENILTGMFFELVTAEIVVADVSIWNPNVYYECGIRDGVRRRGFIAIHGGWAKSPFDQVVMRRFAYQGELWLAGTKRGVARDRVVKEQVAALAAVLKSALAVTDSSEGSLLYAELPGLNEPNWSGLQNRRARYFRGLSDDWRDRIAAAEARGLPGDILTLAEDAPTRYFADQITLRAAKALMGMHRFEAAVRLLEQMRKETNLVEVRTSLGLAYGRLGRMPEAKVLMESLEENYGSDPEVGGILGRVYKDLWRASWDRLTDPSKRLENAAATSNYAVSAAASYERATWEHLDSYWNAINVLSLLRLLEHVKDQTGRPMALPAVQDATHLPTLVRVAANRALRMADKLPAGRRHSQSLWPTATLGELELLAGELDAARSHYQRAATTPGITCFQIASMRQQVQMMEMLGYRADAAHRILDVLNEAAERVPKPSGEYGRVFVASGHMVDKPDRRFPRFPPAKEQLVRARMAETIDSWRVGPGDLAICGGARGADILFAELCRERGAHVRLMIALPEDSFLNESVRIPTGQWADRYHALKGSGCEVWVQREHLGDPPTPQDVWERNNRWILNTARAEAPPQPMNAVLVWDEKEDGDGKGGTSHFARSFKGAGDNEPVVINPTKL
jgi:tetratricopeptide (TPR) repeat protein